MALVGNEICSFRAFGSKVKGTDATGSDIDIFITIKRAERAFKKQILDAAFSINRLFARLLLCKTLKQKVFYWEWICIHRYFNKWYN